LDCRWGERLRKKIDLSEFAELIGSGELVNADIIARQISPHDTDTASLIAGRRVIKCLDHLISKQENFVYETTLSSKQSIDLSPPLGLLSTA
jgi:predicted ABC-type ATPase